MATRTIPVNFPLFRERDYFTHKIAAATKIRNLAQAQNYIWAKAYRVYSTMAYEGNGNKQTLNISDPAEETLPNGATGICLGSFAAPPNWGPSARVKVQGRSSLVNGTGSSRGTIVVAIYELDGTYLNAYVTTTYSTNGTNDWNVEIATPQDHTTQIRVFMSSAMNSGEGAGASHQVKFISARYQLPNAAEMNGDAATIGWSPYAHVPAADLPMASAFLVGVVRDTRSLYAMRPPELCQSYLAENYNNTSTFTEVGRYVVWVPPLVTQGAGKLVVWCSNGGAGNEARVLVNGTVVQTFTALAAGETELTVTAFNLTTNAENTITVETKSTAASADWGTIVHGVHLWEETVSLGLPGGTSVPSAYQPLDEAELLADKAIVADLSGAARAGLKKIFENNTWLARHRLRWLIGDWRHRALKRIADDQAVPGTGTRVGPYWDWTRGPDVGVNYNLYHPRNISMIGDGTTVDDGGTAASDSKDGLGKFQTGYSTGGAASSSSWPTSQKYLRHGQRVGRWRTDSGTSTSAISLETGARIRFLGRGRRLPPSYVRSFDNGQDGPLVEDSSFNNQGSFTTRFSGAATMVLSVVGSTVAPNRDVDPRWYGPVSNLHSTVGSNFNVTGRCPKKSTPPPINPNEGMLFEMELQSCLLMDEPLIQADIDALT